MEPKAVGRRMTAVVGDITQMKVDAIVNAANSTLLGGGGVDGAIHPAAGPDLLMECEAIGGCATGSARITSGHRLPAQYVIHTVGPVWQGGHEEEERMLAQCYRNSLKLAVEYKIKTLAFPAISTGAYGFPQRRACKIAVHTVKDFLEKDETLDQVIFVCYDEATFAIYERELQEVPL